MVSHLMNVYRPFRILVEESFFNLSIPIPVFCWFLLLFNSNDSRGYWTIWQSDNSLSWRLEPFSDSSPVDSFHQKMFHGKEWYWFLYCTILFVTLTTDLSWSSLWIWSKCCFLGMYRIEPISVYSFSSLFNSRFIHSTFRDDDKTAIAFKKVSVLEFRKS